MAASEFCISMSALVKSILRLRIVNNNNKNTTTNVTLANHKGDRQSRELIRSKESARP